MNGLDHYAEKAVSLGVSKAHIIDTRQVEVANWVRLKCQFGCSGYGACLTCPPYSPTPEYTQRLVAEYSKGLLMQMADVSFRTRLKIQANLRTVVTDLEREVFLDGYYKSLALGAGPCRLCKPCDTRKPCKHPQRARPSMEACGVDVYQTAKNCGFELNVVRTEDCFYSYTTLILIE